ncbi:hypothetical protein [Paenibacillus agilis]|uniref:Uncharacterized protein n=1 Tax=Paenibacillus agilis TaxID=3020863 RepID=A0A559IZI9_9BACL|nr:hypothetical protein [Paenibacillus agilis]TVX93045.1 hypothetical protein FPZ44_08220 [Paenibacillus agilis]
MTAPLLVKALNDYLRLELSNYAAVQGKDGTFKPPNIFDWSTPFKDPKPDPANVKKDDFPYVFVRALSGIESGPEAGILSSKIDVLITFGVYSISDDKSSQLSADGAYDLINLMERVKIALLRQGIIDRRYELSMPYKWEIPDEQAYPMWFGQAFTTWNCQGVIPERGVEIIHGI